MALDMIRDPGFTGDVIEAGTNLITSYSLNKAKRLAWTTTIETLQELRGRTNALVKATKELCTIFGITGKRRNAMVSFIKSMPKLYKKYGADLFENMNSYAFGETKQIHQGLQSFFTETEFWEEDNNDDNAIEAYVPQEEMRVYMFSMLILILFSLLCIFTFKKRTTVALLQPPQLPPPPRSPARSPPRSPPRSPSPQSSFFSMPMPLSSIAPTHSRSMGRRSISSVRLLHPIQEPMRALVVVPEPPAVVYQHQHNTRYRKKQNENL